MARVDLDELAHARREARKEPIEVIFAGETFTLPPEPPGDVLTLLARVAKDAKAASKKTGDVAAAGRIAEAIDEFCRAILGDEAERFYALKPTLYTKINLAEAFPGMYGLGENMGESAASSPS